MNILTRLSASKLLVTGFLLFGAIQLNAQEDQLTILKNIAEKTEYVWCNVKWDSDGKIITYPKSTFQVLSYKHNDIGKLGSFYISENFISKKEADPGQPRPNHPTKPSLFYSTYTGVGTVIIGDLVYEFKRNKLNNIVNGNFVISVIYEVKSKDKKVLKSQLKGKSSNLTAIDHKAVIKEYFSAMKKIQENASENMSEEDINNAKEAKRVQEEKERERMKQVSADFNKGKQTSPTKVAIKNNSSGTICVVVDNTGYSMKIGEQQSFPCNKNVYYGAANGAYCSGEKGELIIAKDSGCNQTIMLD